MSKNKKVQEFFLCDRQFCGPLQIVYKFPSGVLSCDKLITEWDEYGRTPGNCMVNGEPCNAVLGTFIPSLTLKEVQEFLDKVIDGLHIGYGLATLLTRTDSGCKGAYEETMEFLKPLIEIARELRDKLLKEETDEAEV